MGHGPMGRNVPSVGREAGAALFVSASDVRHLLGLDESHYNSYDVDGGDLRLDGSEGAQQVWLCVVPDEVADPPGA